MKKTSKQPGKFRQLLRLIKQNAVSLHHFIWGKGWKRFILAVILTIVILVFILGVTLEVTSTPKFCNTCHNMKPYYQSWKKSSHNHVTCTDCHFPPGIKSKIKGKFTALSMLVNYFTGVYKRSKPWAEISDLSCMREGCHQDRTSIGKVEFKKGIMFDHAPHLSKLRRGKKLRCTSCHSQIVQGSHISVTESTCFLCHFKTDDTGTAIGQCTRCHTPPTAADKTGDEVIPYDHTMVLERNIECQKCHGDMVVGDGAVPKFRCSACHSDIDKLQHYADGQWMHKNHITDHKIECEQCHTPMQHKSVSRSQWVKPQCNSCHPDFHNAQLMLFSGKGGKGLPNHPSPMFESGLNCQACHLYHQNVDDFSEKGEVTVASAKSCEPCHGTGYDKMIQRWKTQTGESLKKLERILSIAKTTVSKYNTHVAQEQALKKIDDAYYNYKLVKFGDSIHNIAFANKLLETSYHQAVQSMKEVGVTRNLPQFKIQEPFTPGDCSNCHSGLKLKTLPVFGWKYSHDIHLTKVGLTCNRCHSNEQKHGQLVIRKQDCMNCHHQEKKAGKELDCKTCHKTQYSIYYSKLQHNTFDIPNVMAEDVACLDCHKNDEGQYYRPAKTVCSNCHEDEYQDMFVQWETASKDLLTKLKQKVETEKLEQGHPAYDTLLLLEKDGSKGIHNPELYEKLVREAMK